MASNGPGIALALLSVFAAASSAAQAPLSYTEAVSATQTWTASQAQVSMGQNVVVSASGEWSVEVGGAPFGPDGAPDPPGTHGFPSNSLPFASLIARVGEHGRVFFIGSHSEFVADTSGVLWLGINDYPTTDNSGALQAHIALPAPASAQTSSGKIVFQSTRDGGGYPDIYAMMADGSDAASPLQLTFADAEDATPTWSPDGTKVAFTSLRDGNLEVYVVDASGGHIPVNLTNQPTAHDSSPAWSPDGTRIAFASNRAGATDIWVMDADGSNPVPLTATDPATEGSPTWSPDGTEIAYSFRDSEYAVYRAASDGTGTPFKIIGSGATSKDISAPDWSPDGQWIIVGYDPSARNPDIYKIRVDGTDETLLSNANGGASNQQGHPTWSSDGSLFAFGEGNGGSADIYVANADGTGVATNLTNNAGGGNGNADWSPYLAPIAPMPPPGDPGTELALYGLGFDTQRLATFADQAVAAFVESAPLSATDRNLLATAIEVGLLRPIDPRFPDALPSLYDDASRPVGALAPDNAGNPLTIRRADFTDDLVARADALTRVLGGPGLDVLLIAPTTEVGGVSYSLAARAAQVDVSHETLEYTRASLPSGPDGPSVPHRYLFDPKAGLGFLSEWLGGMVSTAVAVTPSVTVHYSSDLRLPDDARDLSYTSLAMSLRPDGLWEADGYAAVGKATTYFFTWEFNQTIGLGDGSQPSEMRLPDPHNLQWVNRGIVARLRHVASSLGLPDDGGSIDPQDATLARRFASLLTTEIVGSGDTGLASTFRLPELATTQTLWRTRFDLEETPAAEDGPYDLSIHVRDPFGSEIVDLSVALLVQRDAEASVNLSTVATSLFSNDTFEVGYAGRIAGTVRAPDHTPISSDGDGAKVTLHRADDGLTVTAKTDETGSFAVTVEEGEYVVTTTAPGYREDSRTLVVSPGSESHSLDVTLVRETSTPQTAGPATAPILMTASVDPPSIHNGMAFTITATAGAGLAGVTADVSQVDTTQTDPVTLEEVGAGLYSATVLVSASNTAESGDKTISVTMLDEAGAEAESAATTVIRLDGDTSFTISLHAGVNLVHVPVKVDGLVGAGDLYEALGGSDDVGMVVMLNDAGKFVAFTSGVAPGASVDVPLADGSEVASEGV